jgi:hypothetical protein
MSLLFAIVLPKPKITPSFPTEKASSTSRAARWIGIMILVVRAISTSLQTAIFQKTIVFSVKWWISSTLRKRDILEARHRIKHLISLMHRLSLRWILLCVLLEHSNSW